MENEDKGKIEVIIKGELEAFQTGLLDRYAEKLRQNNLSGELKASPGEVEWRGVAMPWRAVDVAMRFLDENNAPTVKELEKPEVWAEDVRNATQRHGTVDAGQVSSVAENMTPGALITWVTNQVPRGIAAKAIQKVATTAMAALMIVRATKDTFSCDVCLGQGVIYDAGGNARGCACRACLALYLKAAGDIGALGHLAELAEGLHNG